VQNLLLNIPTRIETERLILRCYEPGDGLWYYAMSQKNRSHLAQYESGNVVMSIQSEEDAEVTVRELAAAWVARGFFVMGAFDRATDEFVAQIYVGPVDWNLPEFEIGYFVDRDHEGRGFVTEAVKATVRFTFEHLKAQRVRIQCDDTNVRSYRVAERCGLTREGHFRQNKRHPDGTFTGTLCFGLLRSEYEASSE
jgi:ribosomal-protein-alanine N-acetyltransferase